MVRCNEMDDVVWHGMVQYEGLAWVMAGMGLFAAIGGLAAWNDKASRIPFVSDFFHPHFSMGYQPFGIVRAT